MRPSDHGPGGGGHTPDGPQTLQRQSEGHPHGTPGGTAHACARAHNARVVAVDHYWPQLERAADRALATGRHQVVAGMVLVPDVLELELTANHGPGPNGYRLVRSDGRSLAAYRAPNRATRRRRGWR